MIRLALTAAALALPAAAGAQDPPPPIAESASDLAYGYCPLFLAGQFALTAPELARHGFGAAIQRQPNAQFGEVQLVSSPRANGELAFGGVPGRVCTVIVGGPEQQAVLGRLRETMSYMGLDFQPTPPPGPAIAGATVETFKAPVESQALYVQFVQAGGATPLLAVQMFAMED